MDIILILMFFLFLIGVWVASVDLKMIQRILLIALTSIVVLLIVINGYNNQ